MRTQLFYHSKFFLPTSRWEENLHPVVALPTMDEEHHDEPQKSMPGSDGFKRHLPEDCVEYSIYFLDKGVNDDETRKKLREIQAAASQLIKQHVKDFLWQRESFKLNLVREAGRSLLHGRTNFGDSIDDEWIIVFLLRELSKQFPSVWIRVSDTDGEFLLIEAANALPVWLNPEIATFRVWIHDGQLLIIPIEQQTRRGKRLESQNDTLSLAAALDIISLSSSPLLHSAKIQEEAFYRLRKYPQEINNSLHHAIIKVPRKLAYVLNQEPAYMSPAVEAFYLRDPIAMRSLQSKDISALAFPPQDFVTMSAKFNRVGFAQLVGQTWTIPVSWRSVPSPKGDARAKQYAEIGMKVTCGFEMLMRDPQNRDNRVVREISILLEDLEADEKLLPSDDAVRKWGMKEDDQKWLDINCADFENELNGNNGQSAFGKGFGSQGTQEHLRKLVSRFGDLMKEDDGIMEGADFLDDTDDDSERGDDSGSDGSNDNETMEAQDPNIDKDDFTKLMQEMLGMPNEVMQEVMATDINAAGPSLTFADSPKQGSSTEGRSNPIGEVLTKDEIIKAMDDTEQELRDAGAIAEHPGGPTDLEAEALSTQEAKSDP